MKDGWGYKELCGWYLVYDFRTLWKTSSWYEKLLHGDKKVEDIVRFYLLKKLPNKIYKELPYEAMRQFIKILLIAYGGLVFDVEYFPFL